MGRRGPKNTPTVLKILRGNPGRRPLPKNEPKPDPISPKCPSWLDKDAKKEWKRIVPELEKLGLITIIDGTALAGYCQGYSLFKQATEVIRDNGLTCEYINKNGAKNTRKRPEVDIAFQSFQVIKAFCAEFGLTPSARGRMTMPGKKEEADPLEEFLSRGKKNIAN